MNAPDRRRLQMADIARMAGVSVSTVSRALNGSKLINPETRSRIETLARSYNYSINVSAKNLRLQRNQTIAVVIPYDAASHQHITDPFFLSMLGSLADAITDRGFDMLLSRIHADGLDGAARLVDSGTAMGVVLIGQWRHHHQLNELAARRVPVVVWGAQMPEQLYCTVGGDNVRGGRLATEHLLEQGRRRIVFLGDPQLPEVGQRLSGYRAAHKHAKVSILSALEVAVPFDEDSARHALHALMEQKQRFDGVVACSDLLAIAAIKALRERGRQVPSDVAVVGYDDMPIARFFDPPLTSVHQPVPEAAVQLVDALLAMLHGQATPPRTLPVTLVARASSQ